MEYCRTVCLHELLSFRKYYGNSNRATVEAMSQVGIIQVIQGESTLGQWVLSIIGIGSSLKKRWKPWLLMTLFGLLIGAGYGYTHPQKFQAILLIAVEDDDSNGWQNLLQQFGIDVGGNNPGGIFKGESLVRLFTTRNQVERSLLKEVTFADGETTVMANRIFRQSKYASKPVFSDLNFTSDRSQFSPLQDSALMLLFHHVVNDIIGADKPERKLSLISLTAVHQDKYLAEAMTRQLIEETSEYYIELLTKKARLNLEVLRREADSVRIIMDQNMYSSASSSDLNINPNRASLRIDQNRSLVDLQISVSLYGEIIKNLKLAEIGLRKQTPIIQIVDVPQFPLPKVGLALWQWSFVFGFGFSLAYMLFISLLPPEKI